MAIERAILLSMQQAIAADNRQQRDSAARLHWDLMEEKANHHFTDIPLGSTHQRELEKLREELGITAAESIGKVGSTLDGSMGLVVLHEWKPENGKKYKTPDAWSKKMQSLTPDERRVASSAIGTVMRAFIRIGRRNPTVDDVREHLEDLASHGIRVSEYIRYRVFSYFTRYDGDQSA